MSHEQLETEHEHEPLMITAGPDDGRGRWDMNKAATIGVAINELHAFKERLDIVGRRITANLDADTELAKASAAIADAERQIADVETRVALWNPDIEELDTKIAALENEISELLEAYNRGKKPNHRIGTDDLRELFSGLEPADVIDILKPIYLKHEEVLSAYDDRDKVLDSLGNLRTTFNRKPQAELRAALGSKIYRKRIKNSAEDELEWAVGSARNVEGQYIPMAERLYESNPEKCGEMPTEDFAEVLKTAVGVQDSLELLPGFDEIYNELVDELREDHTCSPYSRVIEFSKRVASATSGIIFKPRGSDEERLPKNKKGGIAYEAAVIDIVNTPEKVNVYNSVETYTNGQKCADLLTYVNRMLTAYRHEIEEGIEEVNTTVGAAIFEPLEPHNY